MLRVEACASIFNETKIQTNKEMPMPKLIRHRTISSLIRSTLCMTLLVVGSLTAAQDIPRTADGRPDFNGIWQAINTANWDVGLTPQASVLWWQRVPLERFRRVWVSLREMKSHTPLKPVRSSRKTSQIGCLMIRWSNAICRGSRANYLPFPFQIVQSTDHIIFAYEFASASRIVYVDQPDFEAPILSWMGHNLARYEGDTLVIEVTDQVPETWLDHAGNHHTDALRVTERYTHVGPNVIQYEATLEDPNVYTRPWKVSYPLYRRLDDNMQLLEFKCVEFTEELLYGHLRKVADTNE